MRELFPRGQSVTEFRDRKARQKRASKFCKEKAQQNSATEKRTKKSEQIPRGKSATEFSDRKARQKSTRKLCETSQITVS
jgi:hypothetical protein